MDFTYILKKNSNFFIARILIQYSNYLKVMLQEDTDLVEHKPHFPSSQVSVYFMNLMLCESEDFRFNLEVHQIRNPFIFNPTFHHLFLISHTHFSLQQRNSTTSGKPKPDCLSSPLLHSIQRSLLSSQTTQAQVLIRVNTKLDGKASSQTKWSGCPSTSLCESN